MGSLQIILGRKYGLVGRNGSGKTTLLRHLARREISGLPKGLTILHVQQEVRGDDYSVLDTVLASDLERESLMREEEEVCFQLRQLAMMCHDSHSCMCLCMGGLDGWLV